jgi:hypothetical protein
MSSTSPSPAPFLKCYACLTAKPPSEYSKTQKSKASRPKCKLCIAASMPPPLTAMQLLESRRCKGGCYRLLHDSNFDGESTTCNRCVTKNAERLARNAVRQREEEFERANNARRNPKSGACRVKDVAKVYGHKCEIPLRCYQAVGVANSRNDFVTAEDVEQASRQWDGEGILYDIDTQWGAMPWGGAYSDSMQYPSDGEGGYMGQGYGY